MTELQLVGDVAPADVEVDAWRRVAAESDTLYSVGAALDEVDRGGGAAQGVVGARRTRSNEHVVDRCYATKCAVLNGLVQL